MAPARGGRRFGVRPSSSNRGGIAALCALKLLLLLLLLLMLGVSSQSIGTTGGCCFGAKLALAGAHHGTDDTEEHATPAEPRSVRCHTRCVSARSACRFRGTPLREYTHKTSPWERMFQQGSPWRAITQGPPARRLRQRARGPVASGEQPGTPLAKKSPRVAPAQNRRSTSDLPLSHALLAWQVL